MKIAPGVHAIGLALHIPRQKTLVFADLHLGIEDALRRKGTLVPRQHYKEVIKRMTKTLAATKNVRRIVLNGDLKHAFGEISDQEWREIKRLIDVLQKGGREIIIVKGNHDVRLGPVARDKNVSMVKEYKLDDILILHGDAKPGSTKGVSTIIIGHEHPVVVLRDKAKAEKYKCFLVTTYWRKNLVVQPSFGPLTQGVDLLHGKPLSPLLGANVRRGAIYIVDEESDNVLNFGKLSKLQDC